MVAFEPSDGITYLTQMLDGLWEVFGLLVVEVSKEAVAGGEVAHHAFVEVGEVMAGSYEDDTLGVAAYTAEVLEELSADAAAHEEQEKVACYDTDVA